MRSGLLQPEFAAPKLAYDGCIVKSLDQRVSKTIREMRMLAPGDRAAVAVSGGSDSVALFRLLQDLRDQLGITLLVLHFDHMLRGAESEADAHFVADLARRSNVEFILDRADVSAAAAKHKWNIEDAARRLRYAFFERVVRERKATRVAVAHTADDQAETVLMHLLQGTGLPGLAGIYPLAGPAPSGSPQERWIVRPLLDVRREELREYLRAKGELWREDPTNLDPRRFRAHIRQSLLPLLEREFTPQATDRLCRVARLAREDEAFWNALVEEQFTKLVRAGDGLFAVQARELLAPPAIAATADLESAAKQSATPALRALTERLVRRLYQETRGELRGLTATHVEQVIHLAAESASGRRLELPGGVSVERSFGELIFTGPNAVPRRERAKETNASSRAFQYLVSLPERGAAIVPVPELRRRFRLKLIDWPAGRRDTKSDCLALDAELLRAPLILRNWRAGDAFRPHGRRNVQKVKRLFLAGRVPSRERSQWPVLESCGRVAWVRGMPPADDFCAGANTRAGVVIEEDQL
jgi:tRNA(Ile)-lysidine synthase